MKRVLLAVGDNNTSNILRKYLNQYTDFFLTLEQEVMHFQYLEEIVDIEKPDILIVHEHFLPSDFETTEEREKNWLDFFQRLRLTYDDQIRVVFICERPFGDPFFNYLVGVNVLDIFNTNSISLSKLIEQLKEKPKYANITKLLQNSLPQSPNSNLDEEDSSAEDEDEENASEESNQEKPIIQKVVEKKVKVVNKQVIKRDYNIQILNQVEKVVGVPIDKKLVVVASPLARSGSTFVSHILAKQIADYGVNVTYIENPFGNHYSYDRFAGHEHTENYKSKFNLFSENPNENSTFSWSHEGVDLIVKHPSEVYTEQDVNFEKFIKVLMSITSPITILDIGSDWPRSIYQDIYDIATNFYFVLEPDISAIQSLEDHEFFDTQYFWKLVEEDKSSIIFNRFHEELWKNEIFKQLYQDKVITTIPPFSVIDVFESQYKGVFLNTVRNCTKHIEMSLNPVIDDLLPNELLKKKRKKGLLTGIFNKKIQVSKVSEDKGGADG